MARKNATKIPLPRSRTIHVQLSETEKVAFLLDPDLAPLGRYVKTHKCAAYQNCPVCAVNPGEPCLTPQGATSTKVCSLRRDLFYDRVTKEAAEEQAQFILTTRAKSDPSRRRA